jgi:hypothetical protein
MNVQKRRAGRIEKLYSLSSRYSIHSIQHLSRSKEFKLHNMLYPLSTLSLVLLALNHLTQGHNEIHHSHNRHKLPKDSIPFETRAYWMRRANAALGELSSACHFAAFGTVIVNHTDTSSDPKGKLVCLSVNQNAQKGNPTLHGEC